MRSPASIGIDGREGKVAVEGWTELTERSMVEVAEEMAEGGRKILAVDICLADTGIAGPGGATSRKPVGLFYLGLSHQGGTYSQRHIFRGDREQNKRSAAEAALKWLKEYLRGLE